AGVLVSLPPMASSSAVPALLAGRLPSSDAASEIVLTDSEAHALGFASPAGAVGTQVNFTATSGALVPSVTPNQVKQPRIVNLLVVGIVSSNYMPSGAPGGLVGNSAMQGDWSDVAQHNGWRGGEFSSITLLADSGASVEALRQRVQELGFQAQTFGD